MCKVKPAKCTLRMSSSECPVQAFFLGLDSFGSIFFHVQRRPDSSIFIVKQMAPMFPEQEGLLVHPGMFAGSAGNAKPILLARVLAARRKL